MERLEDDGEPVEVLKDGGLDGLEPVESGRDAIEQAGAAVDAQVQTRLL